MFATLEYSGFVPTPTEKEYGQVLVQRLNDELPDQFSTKGKVQRIRSATGLRYSCLLEIYSDSGIFIGGSLADNPKEAMLLAKEKIKGQISNWSLKRKTLARGAAC